MSKQRTRVGVLFGGRSVEHEISVITALQLISALDTITYEPVPVYIDIQGRWFSGEQLLERAFYRRLPGALTEVQEVTLLPNPNIGGLVHKDGEAIDCAKRVPIDVFLMSFHGQHGEDGCVQGLLELAGIPYTGCGVMQGAVLMNKQVCKSVAQAIGVPVLPGAVVEKAALLHDSAGALRSVLETPGCDRFPLFVKPNNLGSSIGIGRAKDEAELLSALLNVFRFDTQALVEPCMTEMFEVNVSVLEGQPPIASVVEIPVASSGALTYEDKYLRGGKKTGANEGMAALTRMIDPPDLPAELREQIRDYAVRTFRALGCAGIGRFDFIVDKPSSKPYFNELNSPPGSFAFYLWEKSHPPRLYTELISTIIEGALKRASLRASLQCDIGFKALLK